MIGLRDVRRARRVTRGVVAAVGAAVLACATSASAALDVPERVTDINPGAGSSSINEPAVLGRYLMFGASNGVEEELWRTDGSAAGTMQVADLNPAGSSIPGTLTTLEDQVVFHAVDASGDELWRSDGTAAGTFQLRDIKPGPGHSSPRSLHVVGDRVLFRADDGVTGTELWGTDGTVAGTQQVRDINDGMPSSVFSGLFPAVAGNISYFAASEAVTGRELWRSDGTEGGTNFVYNHIGGPGDLDPRLITVAGGLVFFTGDDGVNGRELWRSDGTFGGTEMVEDIDGAATDSSVTGLIEFRGMVYFAAEGPGNGIELWRSDGTPAGTEIVFDINPAGDSEPRSLMPVGNRLFFTATVPGEGRELWVSDGEPGGTTQMLEINQGAGSAPCGVPDPTPFGGELYLCATDGVNGRELWRSDGTQAGTELVDDIDPGAGDSDPGSLTVHGDTLYFRADDVSAGDELYAIDVAAPDTALDAGPGEGEHVADRTPSIRLSSTAIDVDRFECSVDGGAFETCAGFDGEGVTRRLGDGPHALSVRAVDVRENPDATPVDRSFVVDGTAKLRILTRKARVRRGKLRVRVRCPKNELTGPCRGKLQVKTRKRVRIKPGARKRKLKLGQRKFRLAPGKRKVLRLKVSPRKRTVLRQVPRARRVRATANVRDALGNKGKAKRGLRVRG